MRYIQHIPHSVYRISLYAWNEKYILKIETNYYEQTYKISEIDVASEQEVLTFLDETFLSSVELRFQQMHMDFQSSVRRHDHD